MLPPKALEGLGTGAGKECSVYIFSCFATHPEWREGNCIYDTSPIAHFLLFKTSLGIQINYNSIIIKVEKKAA